MAKSVSLNEFVCPIDLGNTYGSKTFSMCILMMCRNVEILFLAGFIKLCLCLS